MWQGHECFAKHRCLLSVFGESVKGKRLSKRHLSHCWIETIQLAYDSTGRPLPFSVVAHSTRGAASSWADV